MTNVFSRPITTQRFNLLAMLALFTFAVHSPLYCEEEEDAEIQSEAKTSTVDKKKAPTMKDSVKKLWPGRWKELTKADAKNLALLSLGFVGGFFGADLMRMAFSGSFGKTSQIPNGGGLVSPQNAEYIRIAHNCMNEIRAHGNSEVVQQRIYVYLTQENSPAARQVLMDGIREGLWADRRAMFGIV